MRLSKRRDVHELAKWSAPVAWSTQTCVPSQIAGLEGLDYQNLREGVRLGALVPVFTRSG